MVKVVDVDKLFDEYISDYVYKNIGKVKPEEIENEIPRLYVKFGSEKLKELDGKSPEEYYRQFSAFELIDCLDAHLKKGVSVPDYLCEALVGEDSDEGQIVERLNGDNEEQLTVYLINILIEKNSKKCLNRLIELVLYDNSQTVKELASEYLKDNANAVVERAVLEFKDADENVKEYLTEILSGANRDDRVFEILIGEFIKHVENVPLYAGYLGRYGDERALPYLMTAIENEKLSYADFEELRFAIESLGGEYNKERNFSSDKTFKKIKSQKGGKRIV